MAVGDMVDKMKMSLLTGWLDSEKSSTLVDETAVFETAHYQTLHPLCHWMIGQVIEFLCLDHDIDISPLIESLYAADFSMSLIGVDFIDLVMIRKARF